MREEIEVKRKVFTVIEQIGEHSYKVERKGQFFFLINEGCLNKINKTLYDKSIKTICLNDSALCADKDYPIINEGLTKLLEKKFPNKSSFEL